MRTIGGPAVRLLALLAVLAASGNRGAFCFNQEADWQSAKSIYDFEVLDLSGNSVSLDKYRDHVVVLFNGATRSCPLSAKVFKQLKQLQESYGESKGLRVVVLIVDGIAKSSGTSDDIKEFVSANGLNYDVYAKIAVDGEGAHPLYKWLAMQTNGEKMLFSKVVIGKDGKVLAKLAPTSDIKDVEEIVNKNF